MLNVSVAERIMRQRISMIQYLYIFAIIVAYGCLFILGYDIIKTALSYANPINNTVKFSIISKQLNINIGLILFYSLGFLVAVNAPLHNNMALITIPFTAIGIVLILTSYICFHTKQKRAIGHQPLIPKSFNIDLINPILISLAMVWWGYISNPLFTNLCNSVATELSNWKKSQKPKIYRIDLSNNSATVLIPQFSVGIAGFNQIDWGELNIVEVIDELYQSLATTKTDFNCQIYVNLYYYDTDKYGNKTYNERIYKLLTIPTEEVKRYRNSSYFEQSYDIIYQITRLPFDKKPIKECEQVVE